MTTHEQQPRLGDRLLRYRADESLSGERAAARISAYVYGNILVFATLVPLSDEDVAHGHALTLTLGVAVSTYLAHVFAEIVGHNARAGASMTRADVIHELRDSTPIATSAVVPCLLLAAAWAGWIEGGNAIQISEVYLMIRIALIGFLVQRLRSERPSFRTLLAGVLLAVVAAGISLVKALLGH
ncbi:hypothetical protein KOI35_25935 [Actinoplanes bogorensis]|uniref:Integral membrane protein n=1 Tax=Paractinoplanes bogorensis TaxID=1610840 RepID=A0ABS5YU15_9ACTN|nr:hypothetical protein [Actinoplanes bogorensis]MBU2666956.1 hypothetical protein [Actinoplanes bogorensis]